MTDNQRTDVVASAEAARLAQLRRLQKWIWASPVVGVPIIFLAGSARSEFGLAAFFVWVVAVFALIVRHLLFRCPRCNEYFNWSEVIPHNEVRQGIPVELGRETGHVGRQVPAVPHWS